jgi:hypothetical protein
MDNKGQWHVAPWERARRLLDELQESHAEQAPPAPGQPTHPIMLPGTPAHPIGSISGQFAGGLRERGRRRRSKKQACPHY